MDDVTGASAPQNWTLRDIIAPTSNRAFEVDATSGSGQAQALGRQLATSEYGETRSVNETTRWAPATPEIREAILASLYAERGVLLQKEDLGLLSPADTVYLQDLANCIDYWEEPESTEESRDTWKAIERLANEVLGVQARIERSRRR